MPYALDRGTNRDCEIRPLSTASHCLNRPFWSTASAKYRPASTAKTEQHCNIWLSWPAPSPTHPDNQASNPDLGATVGQIRSDRCCWFGVPAGNEQVGVASSPSRDRSFKASTISAKSGWWVGTPQIQMRIGGSIAVPRKVLGGCQHRIGFSTE